MATTHHRHLPRRWNFPLPLIILSESTCSHACSTTPIFMGVLHPALHRGGTVFVFPVPRSSSRLRTFRPPWYPSLKRRRIAPFPTALPAPLPIGTDLPPPTPNGDIFEPSLDVADALISLQPRILPFRCLRLCPFFLQCRMEVIIPPIEAVILRCMTMAHTSFTRSTQFPVFLVTGDPPLHGWVWTWYVPTLAPSPASTGVPIPRLRSMSSCSFMVFWKGMRRKIIPLAFHPPPHPPPTPRLLLCDNIPSTPSVVQKMKRYADRHASHGLPNICNSAQDNRNGIGLQ